MITIEVPNTVTHVVSCHGSWLLGGRGLYYIHDGRCVNVLDASTPLTALHACGDKIWAAVTRGDGRNRANRSSFNFRLLYYMADFERPPDLMLTDELFDYSNDTIYCFYDFQHYPKQNILLGATRSYRSVMLSESRGLKWETLTGASSAFMYEGSLYTVCEQSLKKLTGDEQVKVFDFDDYLKPWFVTSMPCYSMDFNENAGELAILVDSTMRLFSLKTKDKWQFPVPRPQDVNRFFFDKVRNRLMFHCGRNRIVVTDTKGNQLKEYLWQTGSKFPHSRQYDKFIDISEDGSVCGLLVREKRKQKLLLFDLED